MNNKKDIVLTKPEEIINMYLMGSGFDKCFKYIAGDKEYIVYYDLKK